jgi:hypothetical protein
MFLTTPDMAGCIEIIVADILVSFFKIREHMIKPQVKATPSQTFASCTCFTTPMKVIGVEVLFQLFFRYFLIGGGSTCRPFLESRWQSGGGQAEDTVNQHAPQHHPVDACYYSVVDEPQLS